MKRIPFLLVLVALFVACENESFDDAVLNTSNSDTEETSNNEETNEDEEITINGNQ